jgi:hypothetical protein
MACFAKFCRAPRNAYDSTRATRGPSVHDFARASRGSDIPALLASPSGYVGATSTASTSVATTVKDRTGGTSGQPTSDDPTGEVRLLAIDQETQTIGHLVIAALSSAHLRPRHPHRPVLALCHGRRI